MAVGAIEQQLGRAEQEFYNNKSTASDSLGKDAFLTLLAAQLGNQDPLNPMEDKEFTSQLAEFSSLEQLTNINEGIDNMNTANHRQELLSGVSFIGKAVRAGGDKITKIGNASSSVYYELDESVADLYVNIFDSNGNLMQSITGGNMQSGTYEFAWDGKNYRGENTPDGVYTISIAAESFEGQPVLITTDVAGTVAGVQVEDNIHYLRMTDGRVVEFMDVKEVVQGAQQTPNTSDETDNTDSSSDSSDSDAEVDEAA